MSKSQERRRRIQRGIPEATQDERDRLLDMARSICGHVPESTPSPCLDCAIRLAAHYKRELDISFLDADAETKNYEKQITTLEAALREWKQKAGRLTRMVMEAQAMALEDHCDLHDDGCKCRWCKWNHSLTPEDPDTKEPEGLLSVKWTWKHPDTCPHDEKSRCIECQTEEVKDD